jgi:hypothetical protein
MPRAGWRELEHGRGGGLEQRRRRRSAAGGWRAAKAEAGEDRGGGRRGTAGGQEGRPGKHAYLISLSRDPIGEDLKR